MVQAVDTILASGHSLNIFWVVIRYLPEFCLEQTINDNSGKVLEAITQNFFQRELPQNIFYIIFAVQYILILQRIKLTTEYNLPANTAQPGVAIIASANKT